MKLSGKPVVKVGIINLKVITRAKHPGIIVVSGQPVKIKVAAAPVDGQANAEIIKVLAKKLGVAKSCLEIVLGWQTNQKRIKVLGLSSAEIQAKLGGQGQLL